MHLAILMVTAFILYGCVTAEQGNRIVPDDVKWIEIERTTRAEVVARYGLPPLEFPQRPTRLRKATYVYMRRDPVVFPFYDNLQPTQCQFWVVYNEKGIVQDYGFLGDSCHNGQLQDRSLHLADAD